MVNYGHCGLLYMSGARSILLKLSELAKMILVLPGVCKSMFLYNGLFQKKSTPPRRMGFWKFSQEGGSKTPEIQAEGGVDLKKSSAGVISTDS